MAESRIIQLILKAKDEATAVLTKAGDAVSSFATQAGGKLRALGMEAKTLLENKLIQGIGLAGLITGLKKSFDAAGEFEASLTKLKGTAKIAGVS